MRKILLTGLVYLYGTMVFGQWNPDTLVNNLLVGTAAKGTSTVSNMVAASDGAGGMFVCWTDGRNSASSGNDIFLTKILADGTIAPGFGLGGKPVCTATGNQSALAMVSDGQGGVVIAWTDPRETATNNNDVYAQRMNNAGDPVWTLNGVAIVSSAVNENTPSLVLISSLEVAIVWRFTGTGTDLAFNYVALSDGSKSLANNITIIAEANSQTNQQVVSDENGGIIVVWQDPRVSTSTNGIMVQRYNAGGVRLWEPATGVPVKTPGVTNSASPSIVSDGNGGAVVGWADYRVSSGDPNIFIQRVLFNGEPAWGSEGKEVTNATGIQLENAIVKSGDNFIIGWADRRNGNSNIDLYAQAYNSAGTTVWNSGNPIVVVAEAFNQPIVSRTPVIIPDGTGGASFVWDDRRFTIDNPSPTPDDIEEDIYAQKVNANGTLAFNSAGVPVCNRYGTDQSTPRAVAGSSGSVIVAWLDSRSGNSEAEIYASRLQGDGLLPVSILELAAQAVGKNVAVTWTSANERALSHFEVERSADGISFTHAGNVAARNISGRNTYRFDDLNPLSGINYYRIRSVDRDGTEAFSNIAKVSFVFASDKALLLYPNPAVVNANLQLNNLPGGSYSIRIIDMQGRMAGSLMVELNGTSQTIQVPVGNLGGGIYQVQVINARGEQVAREALLKQ